MKRLVDWLNGGVAWDTRRARVVILAAGLIGGVAAVLLGNTIADATVTRYQTIRFVDDPDETTVDVVEGDDGKVRAMFVGPTHCLNVSWDAELATPPSVTRFAWGYAVRAVNGRGFDHDDEPNQSEPEAPVCYNNKTLGCDCSVIPPDDCWCGQFSCWVTLPGYTCDSADESSGETSDVMDAGETCE